jgi:glycosyltransferase involved in cell wall biosynthesis
MLRFLPALQEHVDVHVILGEDGRLVERLREQGVPVEVLPLEPRLRDLRKARIRLASLDARALAHLGPYVVRLARRLHQLGPDIVHTNSLKAAVYGGVAGRLAGVPVVWHIRDRIAPDYLPASAVRLVRATARVLPAAVVANSHTTLETLPPLRRRRVVHGTVVLDGVALAPRGASPRDALRFGMVGRLTPWKGQHVFISAFAKAFRGTDVVGRIIGSAMFGEEEYAAQLRQQAAELGVADQIEFRGFREDIASELAELDVLVHCSTVPEPFGQVVLEGMAAGLAVIASADGGPAELIDDGSNGLLTPRNDVQALGAALRRLRDESDLRLRLGAGAVIASRQFTPERTARSLNDIYLSVFDRR